MCAPNSTADHMQIGPAESLARVHVVCVRTTAVSYVCSRVLHQQIKHKQLAHITTCIRQYRGACLRQGAQVRRPYHLLAVIRQLAVPACSRAFSGPVEPSRYCTHSLACQDHALASCRWQWTAVRWVRYVLRQRHSFWRSKPRLRAKGRFAWCRPQCHRTMLHMINVWRTSSWRRATRTRRRRGLGSPAPHWSALRRTRRC